MFTKDWYEAASEERLLSLTHVYDEGLSAYLIEHKEQAQDTISKPPYLPGEVYVVKDGAVMLTSRLVLSYLSRYGYTEL